MNVYYLRFAFLAIVLFLTGCIDDDNDSPADTTPPTVSVTTSNDLFYADATLTLTATAVDDVAVDEVVFLQDGQEIGQASEAPYTFDVALTEAQNGTHFYAARAVDSSGNERTSTGAEVLVDIGNKFFGTAPDVYPADYDDLLTYFDQLTPGNGGKWGTVEATQDTMDWTSLDTAYNFARDNGLLFKFHTLIWGQQQPGWMDDDTLTDEEKLAQIDEWMTEIATRYPDLEMIDVVNEPLHAPPAYKDALGGDGDTGWDWVITSFQMARQHFPNAKLLLNDYQILHLEQFTADYLEIINLLNDRGLIDGIGVQAHFLEQTQASMVQTNLDTLAETRLPIYVSEFDLDIANDALHANRMRDLFTVFWDHPQVAGITHWGHLQGYMWRTNGYLLLSDHSTRVGMDWMLCYMSGGTNCDALVPTYVPAGWHGDEYGLTLEAESYDEGEGLVALGNVVAYTNNGDWIAFRGVEFQVGWDQLWVTYAKGNDDGYEASISIHLGSLDNDPVETIVLPPTGGWGNSSVIELDGLDWLPRTDTQDVFIRFNVDPQSEAVANLDSIKIGKPRPAGGNLVDDSSFEGATLPSGWGNWWQGGTLLELSTTEAFTGSQSLHASNRTDNSYPSFTLTTLVSAGTTYTVSAQVMHTGAANDTLRLAAVVSCTAATEPAGHNAYPWIQSIDNVAPNTWTQLSGTLEIPAGCEVTESRIYFEGTANAADLYIDDVQVIPPASDLVADGGFEGATLAAGWGDWWQGDTALELSTAQAFTGSQSLHASNRTDNSYPSFTLTTLVSAGTTYTASAQVMHTGVANDTLRMAAVVSCTAATEPAGHNAYPWIQSIDNVVPNTWTQLTGTLEIPAGCEVTESRIYFEGTANAADLYIDDVSVVAN